MTVGGSLGVQEDAVLKQLTTALLVTVKVVFKQSSIENELGSGVFSESKAALGSLGEP